MPFTNLADRHRCPQPSIRDDGSQLVIGDEWQCDFPIVVLGYKPSTCGKVWRWTDSQMDGPYWAEVTGP